ncbi:ParB/RepB/Spo0J family partition protein [Roseateles sp. P5_E7]
MSPLISNQVQRFPLTHFKPSPTNPRKRFNPTKLAELAESIKRLDVLQPVLSRPNPDYAEGNGMPHLELVAGERRWRGSELAGAADLPTLVKDLTDLEVLDIQLVENIERDDLHPLEEADGMRRLLDASAKAGKPLAAEGLAVKLGKSPRWVFLRLELLNLCDDARDAFLEDTINASVAGLIARMPNVDQQREATARILTGFNGEPFTFRAAADYLRKEFMLDLARAPFNIDVSYSVAGPCHRCDKRSGSKPDLFDDVKTGDLCQDSKCYAAKGEEAHQRLLKACGEAGHRIVQGNDARKLLSGEVKIDGGHYVANEPCAELTTDKRQLFDIFGTIQKGFVTIEHPTTHALVTWVPAKIVKKALKAKGLLRPAAPAPAPAPVAAPAPRMVAAPAEQADEARPVLKPQPLTPKQLESQIKYRSGELFTSTLLASLCKSLAEAEAPSLSILQLLTIDKLLTASDDATALLQGQLAPFPDLASYSAGGARRAAAQKHIAPLNGRELADLLAMLLVAEELSNQDDLHTLETYANYAVALAADLQLDMEAMQAQAEQDAAAQVQAEEDNRLGRNAAGEAFAAAHGSEVAA